jgi:DNA-binding NtrC family response regulator
MDELNGPGAPGQTPTQHPDDGTGTRPTVLVVDDSRVVRAYLHSLLEKEGYAALLAKDGAETLELLSEDVGEVLLDLWMPGMDGLTFLRRMGEIFPDIPAIMITVSREIAHAVEAMKQGAYDYVTKPFDPEALLALVKQVMTSLRQLRRIRHAESELQKAREHDVAIAARIQKTLILSPRTSTQAMSWSSRRRLAPSSAGTTGSSST